MTDADRMHARLNALRSNIDEDQLNEACAQVEQMEDGAEFLPDLLAIMESNPDFDFGTPGEIVHVAESFMGRGYEKELLDSLHRKSIGHTVWMLNRLINGSTGQEQIIYIDLMERISKDPSLNAEARERAMFYLE